MSVAASVSANDTYHASQGLSSSQIGVFLDDPVRWHHVHVLGDWPRTEATPAMQFGTRVHQMVELGGPDALLDEGGLVEEPPHLFEDGKTRRHGEYQAWKKEQLGYGLEIVEAGYLAPYESIWANLKANRHAAKWLACPNKEVEFRWTDTATGIGCKAKLDVLDENAVVDWKTTRKVDARGFQSEVYQRHYDVRLAFYRRALRSGGIDLPIVAVAIENSGSYRVKPYEISSAWIDEADERLSATMDRMAAFELTEELDSDIVCLESPRWAKYDTEYELGE